MMDLPVLIFAVCLAVLWLSTEAGAYVRRNREKLEEDEQADLGVILAAALTLLGLIIGFTFSMATTRYNQRKDYEAAEANAIGTEFARAGLLPAEDAARVRQDVEELSGPACLVLQNPRCAPASADQRLNRSVAD